MDQYFDLVRDQLERACFKGAHRSWWRRRGDVRPARLLALTASTAVVAAVVVVALGVGGTRRPSGPGGSSRPPLTLAQRRRVADIVGRIFALNQPCGHVRPRRNLSISSGTPDSEILSTLGVLRRRATVADTLRPFLHQANLNVAHGIYIRYVRLARTYRGTGYYIIPAADIGSMDRRCIASERSTLQKVLPGVPASLRPAVEQQMTEALVQESPQQGVFLDFAGGSTSGGSGPARIQDIRREGGEFGLDGDGGPSLTLSGVVPDGVASVTITIARNVGRPVIVTGRVVGNVLAVTLRVPARGPIGGPATMIWRASNGHVIRVIRNAPF